MKVLPGDKEDFTFPGLFCMESMESIRYSMDIMDSMWNDHGMVNSIWNLGISTLDSMEQVHMDSAEIPYGNYHDICCQK